MRLKQDKITHKIVGCAMEVHNTLGNGFTQVFNYIFNGIRECYAFQEVIYQRCLLRELNENGIEHQREVEIPIFYKGNEVELRRADFLVLGELMVELKAVIELKDVHLAQAMNHFEAYNLPTGLLINFGARSLQFKRLFNKSWQSKNLKNQDLDNE